MRREGRVRGKSTNKSRVPGRCRSGKTLCRGCRDHPVEKSPQKRRGGYRRFAVDVRVNPSLDEFVLQPSLDQLRGFPLRDLVGIEIDEQWSASGHADEDAVQVGIFLATVNSVIEAALEVMHSGYGDDGDDRCTRKAMTCNTFEIASHAILAGNCTNIIPVIEAFQSDLGSFENAVEGSSFSDIHFARKWGSVLSEESW